MSTSFPLDFTHGPGYCALAWEENENSRDPDFDISCVCVDGVGMTVDAAYFKKRDLFNGLITHSGDAKDGVWKGDDEACVLHIPSLPQHVQFVIIMVTMPNIVGLNTNKAVVRVCDGAEPNGRVIDTVAFDSSHSKASGYIFGAFRRVADKWEWDVIKVSGMAKHFQEGLKLANPYLCQYIDPQILMGRPRDPAERFDLSKHEIYGIDSSIKSVNLGLGWDSRCDIDAHCHVYDKDLRELEHVYFGRLTASGITHAGDNLTGDGDGDDETIRVEFDKLQKKVEYIAFTVKIYAGAQNFNDVKGCFVRMFFHDQQKVNRELCRFLLAGSDSGFGSQALMCVIKRSPYGWQLEAIGETTKLTPDKAMARLLGRFIDCRITVVGARSFQEPGTRGKLTLVQGKDLAAMDSNGKSDPYCKIKSKGFHDIDKTEKIKKTLNPVWKQPIQINLPKDKDEITFQIFDYDRFSSDDPMGQVVITADWLKQQIKDGDVVVGGTNESNGLFEKKVVPQGKESSKGSLVFKYEADRSRKLQYKIRVGSSDTKYVVGGADGSIPIKDDLHIDFCRPHKLELQLVVLSPNSREFVFGNAAGDVLLEGVGEGELEVILPFLDDKKQVVGDVCLKYTLSEDKSLH